MGGFIAPWVLDGPINREAFETYIAKVLVPDLRTGDIMLMDNLSSHKGPKVRQMIEAAGAELRYLPPYSPDFNPIEMAFVPVNRDKKPESEQPGFPRLCPWCRDRRRVDRTARETGAEYVSLSISAPEFGLRILFANLGRAADSEIDDDFAVIWNPTE